ncbi:MAG: helix-turn-helix domain-containing protein [bacterium]
MMNENKLYQILQKKDITQVSLANQVGVSSNYINLITSGKRRPTLSLAHKIAQVLNCSIEDIFFPHAVKPQTIDKEIIADKISNIITIGNTILDYLKK